MLRPLVVILVFAGAAALTTVFVLPYAIDANRRSFTPAQWDAIAVKQTELGPIREVDPVRSDETAMLMDDVSGASFGNGRAPVINLGDGNSYKSSDMSGGAADPINVFFGGVGSVDDIKYDMTNDTYGNVGAPDQLYPDMDSWDANGCASSQWIYVNDGTSGRVMESDTNLESGDIYVEGCLTGFDDHQFHMRLWDSDGWSDGPDGSWSVGTAHWDPVKHGRDHSGYYEEAGRVVALTFTVSVDGSVPRWFVGDIWRWNLGNVKNSTDDCITAADGSVSSYPYDDDEKRPCRYADGWAYYIYLVA